VKVAGPQHNDCEQLTAMWMLKMVQTVNEISVQAIEKGRHQTSDAL
jgi:hypothetical protein